MNQISIGLFTPVTNQCLKMVFDYLYALREPTIVYTLSGKRLAQSIELLSREKPITLHVMDVGSNHRADIQKAIQDIIHRALKIVFFIPPGTRVKRRQSADNKQSLASLYAGQLGKTIERVYVDDVAVAYGKYHQSRKKDAPNTYQLSLPLFNQTFSQTSNPLLPPPTPPPRLPRVEIAYQPPPRLQMPRSWTKKEHPARHPKWVERQLLSAMRRDLLASGGQVIGQSSQFNPPYHWPSVEAVLAGRPVKALFALPDQLPLLRQVDLGPPAATRWYTYERRDSNDVSAPIAPVALTMPSGSNEVRVCDLDNDARDLLDDFGQWLTFGERLTINGQRYYLPADYHESYSPTRQWELHYMYPLLTKQLDASGCQYRRQMPLGNYFADYVVIAPNHTEIIECKRYPFRHSLRDALNQLLLYKHLYQYLFSIADSHPVTLTLVLPARTISAQVINIAGQHNVSVRALECDPLQTDMICKKHLAARVEKLVSRSRC